MAEKRRRFGHAVNSDRGSGSLPTKITRRTALLGVGGVAVILGYRQLVDALYTEDEPVVGCTRSIGAYLPYFDQDAAFAAAATHNDGFDDFHPVWYSLDSRGEVVLADDEATEVDRAAARRLQRHGQRIVPTVTNLRNGSWRPDLVTAMLADPATRSRHVDALVRLAVTNDYDGIDLDYEDLPAGDRDAYSAFVVELADELHAEQRTLTTSVYAKVAEPGKYAHQQAQDYAAIGAACDQVGIMAYDFHWGGSAPGPAAPHSWVEETVRFAITQIPRQKVRLGIMLVGYDWKVGGSADSVTFEQARELVDAYDVRVTDADSGQAPHFRYVDDTGAAREVWYQDAATVAENLRLVEEYDLSGAFFWRLGGEDPSTWNLLQRPQRCAPSA